MVPAQQKGVYITDEEEDKLREAQDPSKRIQLYVEIEQARLQQLETFRSKPRDPRYDNGGFMDNLLTQFISVNEEMKDWIDDQYDRNGDMRQGLHTLLESGPKELEELRQIQQSPDPDASAFTASLKDAIDDLSDALDGATQALSGQEKKFGQMKKEEKAEAQDMKLRQKEENKRTKEEKKLRKKERKSAAPSDSDQN